MSCKLLCLKIHHNSSTVLIWIIVSDFFFFFFVFIILGKHTSVPCRSVSMYCDQDVCACCRQTSGRNEASPWVLWSMAWYWKIMECHSCCLCIPMTAQSLWSREALRWDRDSSWRWDGTTSPLWRVSLMVLLLCSKVVLRWDKLGEGGKGSPLL